MALSDMAIKKAKPREKIYTLKDADGLYLEIKPSGKKYWRLRYWIDSKENRLSLGEYPLISLAEARSRRDDKRRMIKDGVDPVALVREQKAAVAPDKFFESVAREWAHKNAHRWTEGHAELNLRRLEMNIFPYIGKKPVGEISAPELLECLRRIEARGALEVTRRVRGLCSMIFRYAIATGKAERDVAADLIGACATPKKQHRPTITDPQEVGRLMDTVISLRRPTTYSVAEGARFEVHLTKARGIVGEDAMPFEVHLRSEGNQLIWDVNELVNVQAEQLKQLLAEGFSIRDCADEMGVSKSVVHRLKKKLEEGGDAGTVRY